MFSASSPNVSWFPRWRGRGFALLGLGVTLVFTLGLWRYFVLEVERREAARFHLVAERQAEAIQDRLLDYQRVLLGASALFAASLHVDRVEFRRFVSQLQLEDALPGIQGTGYAVAIAPQRMPKHLLALRAEGFPHYVVHPAGDRDLYTSIVYIEPFEGRNLRAFGYDMYSEPTRRTAMDRARDTGKPAMTHRLTLIQETDLDVQPGFLIYVPVYEAGRPVSSVAERRRALAGWVYSPFRSVDLMEAIFRQSGQETEAAIYDGTATAHNLLFATTGAHRTARQSRDITLEVAGVRWLGRFRSSETFEAATDRSPPRWVLLAGSMLTLVIAVVSYLDTRHGSALQRQVEERTAELVKARDAAEGASRAKSSFLATMSHELRTPLNAVIGFSAILKEEATSEEQRRQLTLINRSGLQLLELISEILDIASIEAGQLALKPAPLQICDAVREQCELLQIQAQTQGITLKLSLCEPGGLVLADAARLGQVLRNLISNAVKFTDRGGVTVRCRRLGNFAQVEVEDTGVGIPAEDRATLFQPFGRADDGPRNRPGTGLGLAISRRLVEAMGGEIGFESEVNRGSRFWFTVPLAHGRAPDRSRPG